MWLHKTHGASRDMPDALQAADFLADQETVRFVADLLAGRVFDVPAGEIGHAMGPKGAHAIRLSSINAPSACKYTKVEEAEAGSTDRVSENTNFSASVGRLHLLL